MHRVVLVDRVFGVKVAVREPHVLQQRLVVLGRRDLEVGLERVQDAAEVVCGAGSRCGGEVRRRERDPHLALRTGGEGRAASSPPAMELKRSRVRALR